MSTPAITRQDAWQFQVTPPGLLPGSISWYRWVVGPNPPAAPRAAVPPFVVGAPAWPNNPPWGLGQKTPAVYIFACVKKVNPVGFEVAAFDINPQDLVNGKYPQKWSLALPGTCNSALTASDLVSVKTPPTVPPAAGPAYLQEPLLVVVQDQGLVTVARNLFGAG